MQIITRVDQFNRPVVFMLDTLTYPEQGIKVWYPDNDETVESNLSYYKASRATNDAEEKTMADQFVKKFGLGDGFTIRRKLFRYSHMAALNSGKTDSPAIVTTGEATHVKVNDDVIIPIEEFTEKLILALGNAFKETFKK